MAFLAPLNYRLEITKFIYIIRLPAFEHIYIADGINYIDQHNRYVNKKKSLIISTHYLLWCDNKVESIYVVRQPHMELFVAMIKAYSMEFKSTDCYYRYLKVQLEM